MVRSSITSEHESLTRTWKKFPERCLYVVCFGIPNGLILFIIFYLEGWFKIIWREIEVYGKSFVAKNRLFVSENWIRKGGFEVKGARLSIVRPAELDLQDIVGIGGPWKSLATWMSLRAPGLTIVVFGHGEDVTAVDFVCARLAPAAGRETELIDALVSRRQFINFQPSTEFP